MTFNDNARIDTGGVQSRRGGGRGAMIGGSSVLGVIAVVLLSQLFGVDLSPLLGGGGTQGSQEQVQPLENCQTGADANRDDRCRMAAATDSLNTFWAGQFESGYHRPTVVLYSGYTDSACGTASAAVGPFYCPSDESIYLDTGFFETLRSQFGATAGPLAQMYVLAHEWGHHISNLTGDLQRGGGSGPASGSVRVELQADCYAGAWIRDASTVTDSQGVPFMQPVSREELNDAMNAASVIGDDYIQQRSGGGVNPEGFTHGTSEQRQRWLQEGYQGGALACDTFSPSAGEL